MQRKALPLAGLLLLASTCGCDREPEQVRCSGKADCPSGFVCSIGTCARGKARTSAPPASSPDARPPAPEDPAAKIRRLWGEAESYPVDGKKWARDNEVSSWIDDGQVTKADEHCRSVSIGEPSQPGLLCNVSVRAHVPVKQSRRAIDDPSVKEWPGWRLWRLSDGNLRVVWKAIHDEKYTVAVRDEGRRLTVVAVPGAAPHTHRSRGRLFDHMPQSQPTDEMYEKVRENVSAPHPTCGALGSYVWSKDGFESSQPMFNVVVCPTPEMVP